VTTTFDIITIFPGMFQGPISESIISKAMEKKYINISIHDLREFTHDRHRVVDDSPYGGGPGMIMKPEPICEAVDTLRNQTNTGEDMTIIMMTPQGKLLNQQLVSRLAEKKHFLLICGHYGGMDERVSNLLNPLEISVGDYVLSGGELPAMVFIDAVSRMIPGVVGCSESVEKDCFINGLLAYPQYTRPAEYKSVPVPEILLSGDHAKITEWRKKQALMRTRERRPDLFWKVSLDEKNIKLLKKPDKS